MKFPEKFRIKMPHGIVGRDSNTGDRFGCFLIQPNPVRKLPTALRCLASSGDDWPSIIDAGIMPEGSTPWEHVSISLNPPAMTRCPTWEEMCYVKSLFWDDEEAVIQLHPPKSEYVNNARYCLHLWRPVGVDLVRPPSVCVGMM